MGKRVIRSKYVRSGEGIVHNTARYEAGTDKLENVLFDLLCYVVDRGINKSIHKKLEAVYAQAVVQFRVELDQMSLADLTSARKTVKV